MKNKRWQRRQEPDRNNNNKTNTYNPRELHSPLPKAWEKNEVFKALQNTTRLGPSEFWAGGEGALPIGQELLSFLQERLEMKYMPSMKNIPYAILVSWVKRIRQQIMRKIPWLKHLEAEISLNIPYKERWYGNLKEIRQLYAFL